MHLCISSVLSLFILWQRENLRDRQTFSERDILYRLFRKKKRALRGLISPVRIKADRLFLIGFHLLCRHRKWKAHTNYEISNHQRLNFVFSSWTQRFGWFAHRKLFGMHFLHMCHVVAIGHPFFTNFPPKLAVKTNKVYKLALDFATTRGAPVQSTCICRWIVETVLS